MHEGQEGYAFGWKKFRVPIQAGTKKELEYLFSVQLKSLLTYWHNERTKLQIQRLQKCIDGFSETGRGNYSQFCRKLFNSQRPILSFFGPIREFSYMKIYCDILNSILTGTSGSPCATQPIRKYDSADERHVKIKLLGIKNATEKVLHLNDRLPDVISSAEFVDRKAIVQMGSEVNGNSTNTETTNN
ncbi:hypothetical protein CLF_111985 [Clonorchis sinensis]|uniref:Uncharacterized protein n=1 Tax=Clonorchis sinensis TaxID=79923 RepID=G7YM65_CLOSI|nr:hypothetical protein CLF_111985 [Clonorchis sinensis]